MMTLLWNFVLNNSKIKEPNLVLSCVAVFTPLSISRNIWTTSHIMNYIEGKIIIKYLTVNKGSVKAYVRQDCRTILIPFDMFGTGHFSVVLCFESLFSKTTSPNRIRAIVLPN